MEGIDFNVVKKRCEGRKAYIKKDAEYQDEKCTIKECNRKYLIVETTDGKKLQKQYSEIEAVKNVSQWDLLEFKEWFEETLTRWEKEKKDTGKHKGAIDVIYKKACKYLNCFEKTDLEDAYRVVSNGFGTPVITEYYNVAYEMIKAKMERSDVL